MIQVTVAIIGSRNFTNSKFAEKTLNNLVKDRNLKITIIYSGAAKGADKIGAIWGRKNNIEVIEFIPEWDKYKKAAGFMRNSLIIENADIIIAFYDMKSKGTADSLKKAKELNKEVIIIDVAEIIYQDELLINESAKIREKLINLAKQ